MKIALCLVLIAGSAAIANPTGPNWPASKRSVASDKVAPPIVLPEALNWSDNFDSYANGSTIAGQGNWEIWYSGGLDGTVTNAQAASGPHSLSVPINGDIVQRFNVSGGAWRGGCDTYVGSAHTGEMYFICMNQYQTPTDNWSVQVKLDGTLSIVESQWGLQQTALIRDSWQTVEFCVDLNAAAPNLEISYGGTAFATGLDWANNTSAGGTATIACFDLFNFTHSPTAYFDNVFLSPKCYADCEGDGDLDVFDFLCFQGEYANQTAYADCECDGDWDVFDFLCFQGAFATGCP